MKDLCGELLHKPTGKVSGDFLARKDTKVTEIIIEKE
jgi:hypothetical protein